MDVTLIISTYNRPDALHLVLQSVARQTVMPAEVIIADDGSGDVTHDVVEMHKRLLPARVIHAHQKDEGFRLARVRNLGVSLATSEYLVFIDGDMILHKDFLRSHIMHSKRGVILLGSRVLISPEATKRILDSSGRGSINITHVKPSHFFNMISSSTLSRIFTKQRPDCPARGCNFSLYLDDYEKINGFNEDFVGWGVEDSEFVWRLVKSGVSKAKLRCCAVAYHLDHGHNHERRYSKLFQRNVRRFEEVKRLSIVRCANGLDNHIPTSVVLQES